MDIGNKIKKIVIFASGEGTNAQNIIELFKNDTSILVESIVCNNSKAGVITRAKELGIPLIAYNDNLFFKDVDLIVLAGFLKMLPHSFISKHKNKIINIHPSLLPKYGGKGMYGDNVHLEVIKNKESKTGITIHLVDEIYDHGKILFQKSFKISKKDDLDIIKQKIHILEYKYYPKIIKKYLKNER